MHKPRVDIREWLKKYDGELPNYSFPGGYTIIYWFKEENSPGIFPTCGDCAGRILNGEYGEHEFYDAESGDAYEEFLLCENCYKVLADYIPEED